MKCMKRLPLRVILLCYTQSSAVRAQSNIAWSYLQELRHNINQMLNQQKTPHTSPYLASYGVSFMNICEKIDCDITAPHYINSFVYMGGKLWNDLHEFVQNSSDIE